MGYLAYRYPVMGTYGWTDNYGRGAFFYYELQPEPIILFMHSFS